MGLCVECVVKSIGYLVDDLGFWHYIAYVFCRFGLNMLSVSDIAAKILGNTPKPFAADVFLKWKEIVGEPYSSMSTPYKVTTFAKQKILIVQAVPGCGVLIQHESWEILQRVNDYLKQKYFAQVKVIQASR